jgi:hypothetical protein
MSNMLPPAVVEIMKDMPTVEVKHFAINGKDGGTRLCNDAEFSHSLHFNGQVKVKIVNGFHDYEVGYRLIGIADTEELKSFMKEHSGIEDGEIYFHESEMINVSPAISRKIMCTLDQADDIRSELGSAG